MDGAIHATKRDSYPHSKRQLDKKRVTTFFGSREKRTIQKEVVLDDFFPYVFLRNYYLYISLEMEVSDEPTVLDEFLL